MSMVIWAASPESCKLHAPQGTSGSVPADHWGKESDKQGNVCMCSEVRVMKGRFLPVSLTRKKTTKKIWLGVRATASPQNLGRLKSPDKELSLSLVLLMLPCTLLLQTPTLPCASLPCGLRSLMAYSHEDPTHNGLQLGTQTKLG